MVFRWISSGCKNKIIQCVVRYWKNEERESERPRILRASDVCLTFRLSWFAPGSTSYRYRARLCGYEEALHRGSSWEDLSQIYRRNRPRWVGGVRWNKQAVNFHRKFAKILSELHKFSELSAKNHLISLIKSNSTEATRCAGEGQKHPARSRQWKQVLRSKALMESWENCITFCFPWPCVNAGAYDFTFLCMCSGFAESSWVDVFGKNQRKIQQF